MEAVEAAAIRDQLRPFLFEDLPDRPLGPLRVGVRFRPGQTFIEEPGVQLVIALEPQPRREEAFAHEADLVLDLALLPARRRRAGDRLDQVMRAHLEEAAIVLAVLADEDRLHRRLHVVVDAACAGALEERERALVGVEHHLLRLARVGAHEHHPAVAEPNVRDLHRRRHAADETLRHPPPPRRTRAVRNPEIPIGRAQPNRRPFLPAVSSLGGFRAPAPAHPQPSQRPAPETLH